MQIRVEQPFILYADVDVTYAGRAASTLARGNYLILHKSDGTLLIMGGERCKPSNYQAPGAVLTINNNILTSSRKNEIITIVIHSIINYIEFQDWSIARTKVTKTERDLCEQITYDLGRYIPNVKESYVEFQTPVGNVDILAIDTDNTYHILEVKRGRASLAACSQLGRYLEYFKSIGRNVRGYVASPQISKNAAKYAENAQMIWLQVEHGI